MKQALRALQLSEIISLLIWELYRSPISFKCFLTYSIYVVQTLTAIVFKSKSIFARTEAACGFSSIVPSQFSDVFPSLTKKPFTAFDTF